MKSILLICFFISATAVMAQKTDSLPPKVYHWDSLAIKKQKSWTTRSVIEGSTTSLSWFEVTAITLEPGKASPPSSVYYDLEELIIVKEGQVNITINSVSKKLGAGQYRLCHAAYGAYRPKCRQYKSYLLPAKV